MKTIWLFITVIPDLVKLLEALDRAVKEAEIERTVSGDLKTIHQAFADKDPAKITALFSGNPGPGVRPPAA